jgi:hypothetical protein
MKKFVAPLSLMALALMLVFGLRALADDSPSTKIKCQINSIAEDSKSMKCQESKEGGKNLTMNLSDKTKVIIDGENGKISDLKKGDKIECTCTKTETANTYNCSEIRRNKKDQTER